MSKESLGLPIFLATACATGAVALGMYANSRFQEAGELSDARACVETVISGTPDPNICVQPQTDATPEELSLLENHMQGQQYGNYALGGAALLGLLAAGGAAAANGRTAVKVFIRRRRGDDTDPQAV
jgi:hypothetical protein